MFMDTPRDPTRHAAVETTQICWPGGSGSACIGGVLRGNNGTTHRCHVLESRVFFAMITICLRYGGPDRLNVFGIADAATITSYPEGWNHNVHISSSPGNQVELKSARSFLLCDCPWRKILRTQIAGHIGHHDWHTPASPENTPVSPKVRNHFHQVLQEDQALEREGLLHHQVQRVQDPRPTGWIGHRDG